MSLEFGVAMAYTASAQSLRIRRVHPDGHALRRLWRSRPARTTPLRHIEIAGHYPAKRLVQGGVARRE